MCSCSHSEVQGRKQMVSEGQQEGNTAACWPLIIKIQNSLWRTINRHILQVVKTPADHRRPRGCRWPHSLPTSLHLWLNRPRQSAVFPLALWPYRYRAISIDQHANSAAHRSYGSAHWLDFKFKSPFTSVFVSYWYLFVWYNLKPVQTETKPQNLVQSSALRSTTHW